MSLHALARIPAPKRSALLVVLFVAYSAASGAAAGAPELEDSRFALCKADPKIPDRPPHNPAADKLGSIEVLADRVEVLEENESIFVGGVSLVRDQQAVVADLLTYERGQGVIEAEGHLLLWDPALFWSGKYGRLDLDNDRVHLEYGEYRMLQRRGRGGARIINLDTRENVTQLKDVDYTTCSGRVPDWQLAAKSMKLDHTEEWGEAEHVVLRVRETPVFYLPYMTFPLSDKRKTGFLPPTVGSSSNGGFDLSTPYYWNIAPQHDATIQPRILSNRGVLLGGQYRYLLETGKGELDFEYLPADAEFEDKSRSLVGVIHEQDFAGYRGHTFLTYNRVSDAEYFEDFGNNLALASTVYLERRADISYSGDHFYAAGRFLGFQTIDPTIPETDRPYYQSQIYFSTRLPAQDREINLDLFGLANYFDRDEGVIGGRIDLKPVISYPVHAAGGFLVPRVSLEHTQYYLENTEGTDNRPSRTLPIVSLDSGLVFERDLDFAALPAVQTLEPRIFYLYVPEQDQDELPLFDTGQYDISFGQLFRENRFSGYDRLGDANQMAVAVTSRIINRDTGWEHLRASVGHTFHFEDRRVTLPGETADTDPVSEVLAEVTARLPNGLSARGDLFWDPNDATVEYGLIGLRYGPDPDTIVNADYRIRRNIRGVTFTDIEQTDLAFRWPLNLNWSVIGKWTYSLDASDTIEAAGGFEYNSCCWGVRGVARRFLSSSTGEFDNAFYFQIELKGLAGFGRSTANYLKRSIPGYENEF